MKTKKSSIIFLFLISLFSNISIAQLYTVSTDNALYNNLVDYETIDEEGFDLLGGDPLYYSIPIGFSFEINGNSFDSIRIGENGFVKFYENGVHKYGIMMFDSDLSNLQDSLANSPINYITEGQSGNRIFKCEYKNSGFFKDIENDDSISFQLWLYEACGEFEVRIGPSSINSNVFWNNNIAPFIGYRNFAEPESWYLAGPPNNPIIQDNLMIGLEAIPSNGIIYKFSNCTVSTIESKNYEVKVYPNPVKSILSFNSETIITSVTIYNLEGLPILKKEILIGENNSINLERLKSGFYMLEFKIDNERILKRFIKV